MLTLCFQLVVSLKWGHALADVEQITRRVKGTQRLVYRLQFGGHDALESLLRRGSKGG